jgi:triacylglycerol lipase
VLDTLSPARRRVVLLLVLAVLVAVVAVVSVVVVRTTQERGPAPQGDAGPVLLVSGYGGGTGALEPLRAALEKAGRDVVVVPPVGGGTGDIARQAEGLQQSARDAMKTYGAGSVDVVGYSAGGVVARSWVRDHGGASVARRVMSVGSPHHGTTVADLAAGLGAECPTACRQLEPDSRLLQALNARDETPPGPVFVSVWSTSDAVVVPTSSAHLSGALNLTVQSVCPRDRAGHGDLPSDPVVLALLRTALGTGPPKAPTPAVCTADGG